jgi:hypothetical protein
MITIVLGPAHLLIRRWMDRRYDAMGRAMVPEPLQGYLQGTKRQKITTLDSPR